MQIPQQQVMGAHEVPNLQHNGPELLVVPSYRGPLPQVKQAGLVAEGVVQVVEFSLQGMAKVLPCTNAQSSPVLISYQPPPRQCLPHQQRDSHFDNLGRLHHACHFAELLDVERPVCQLLGIPIKLLRLVQFYV